LLAAVCADASGKQFPILLISDTVNQEWIDRLAEEVIDDLLPRATGPPSCASVWRPLRHHSRSRELELLREKAALNAQTDL